MLDLFFLLNLCVNDFLCCYFESEALNINNKQGMVESDNNNDCRIVKGRRRSAVGKWEDKPLIRVETYKNFSSVCIHSKAYHYVFVTLLSFSLARFASHFNCEFEKWWINFPSIVPMNTERKIFPVKRVLTLKLFFFSFKKIFFPSVSKHWKKFVMIEKVLEFHRSGDRKKKKNFGFSWKTNFMELQNEEKFFHVVCWWKIWLENDLWICYKTLNSNRKNISLCFY